MKSLLLTNETVMRNVKSSVTRNDGPSGISSYVYMYQELYAMSTMKDSTHKQTTNSGTVISTHIRCTFWL